MKTNVLSLEPKQSVSRFLWSAIDVASPNKTDDCREPSFPEEGRESMLLDSADMLVGIKMCRKLTGLSGREILLGVSTSPRHHSTLRGYLRLCRGNARRVQALLVHDLRSYLEIGARQFAADQLIVLRLFLADQLRDASKQRASLPEAEKIETRMTQH
ncbi:hypothetical protein [Methylocystis bryophila]|uniref:Uncharacterized protein n=1 Tax=Methylocystis bryophila TaxID=655015 RepID=A0A1W6MSI5_9HYPH|nr:hypothetical protein [Methylocystis bryophila]ARN80515.1 hypothetical protein B1812_04920 [Methylocystis bryophila]BDV40556.1 hypothetical protein DSM21852_38090 [Methylocystis bryophila]